MVLPIDPPLPLSAGETLELRLQRPTHGDWTWSIKGQQGTRKHSTFLASSEGAKELAKVAPGSSPGLSPRGRRAMHVLQMLGQGHTNDEIVASLVQSHGLERLQSLQEAHSIALHFGGPA